MRLRPRVQFLFHLRSHRSFGSFIIVKTLARTFLYKLLDLFDFATKCPLSHTHNKSTAQCLNQTATSLRCPPCADVMLKMGLVATMAVAGLSVGREIQKTAAAPFFRLGVRPICTDKVSPSQSEGIAVDSCPRAPRV
jgi:hypothetical protein